MAVRAAFFGPSAEDVSSELWSLTEGSAEAALPLVASGRISPTVFRALAGLSALGNAKDYHMKSWWTCAWLLVVDDNPLDLQDDPLLSNDDLRRIGELGRSSGDAAAEVYRESIETTKTAERERARARAAKRDRQGEKTESARDGHIRRTFELAQRIRSGDVTPRPAPAPELVETFARLAPIGAGGPMRIEFETERPILFTNRTLGVPWQALCAAFDAIGAASHAGLDVLHATAIAQPESPSVLWLCRVAAELAGDRRSAGYHAQLSALLATGAFGINAAELAIAMRLGEEHLRKTGTSLQDAWLRLASLPRDDTPLAGMEELAPAKVAKLRRAAKDGFGPAITLEAMGATLEDLLRREREAERSRGPFSGLYNIPVEVTRAIDGVCHYALLGFRELYGLELLVDALPQMEQQLG